MKNKIKPTKQFYCGTSNLILPVRNKGLFPKEYQSGTRLKYYSSLLKSIEINSTFYRLPMRRTIEKWVNEVSADFRFSFKLSKSITHAKGLVYQVEDLYRFLEVIAGAGDKKGCILVQFPASIKISFFQKVRQLLDEMLASEMVDGWRLAIEFRDRSWYCDRVYQMLEYYKAVVVMHDMPKSSPPSIDMEKSFVYLRFHGPEGNYRGSYSDDFLEEYAQHIHDWLRDGFPVFAYFNNTIGDAIHNAIRVNNSFHGAIISTGGTKFNHDLL